MLYSVGLLSLAFQGGAAFSAVGASKLGASAVAGQSRVGATVMESKWDSLPPRAPRPRTTPDAGVHQRPCLCPANNPLGGEVWRRHAATNQRKATSGVHVPAATTV